MSPRVIHFGEDTCHRQAVLRRAGFEVIPCSNLIQLRDALAGRDPVHAICVIETVEVLIGKAIRLTREYCSAPIVFFRETNRQYDEAGIGIVVDTLTPPSVWLGQIHALILNSSRPVTANHRELANGGLEKSGEFRR